MHIELILYGVLATIGTVGGVLLIAACWAMVRGGYRG